MEVVALLEWIGCGAGVAGAALLSLDSPRWSKWGFPFFLVSNLSWIAYSALTGSAGLGLMQACYLLTSVVGCARWLRRRDKH